MTSPDAMLTLARTNCQRRLSGLAHGARNFTPEQLMLMNSLLDEFARKTRSRRHPAAGRLA